MKLKGISEYLLYLKMVVSKTNSPKDSKKPMMEALEKSFLDGVKVGRGEVVEVEL